MSLTRRAVLAGSAAGLALPLSARAAPITIGIAQWGTHSQLDEAVATFRKRLTELGHVDGKDVTYVEENAHFQTSVLPQMIARLKADDPALLLTISTPVSQAAKQVMKGSGIPIVFAAVTDPVLAKLTPSWQAGSDDMTGASNLEDINDTLAFIRALFPQARRIGFPFNPGEDNNVSVATRLKEAGPKLGFSVTELAINSPNDVALRIASLRDRADLIYTPAGGLIQPAIPAISASAAQIGVPVVDSGVMYVHQNIVLAGFAVDYARVGINAADVANKILSGTRPAAIAPVRPGPNDYQKAVSSAQLKKFNMTLPAALKDCGCVVS